MSAIDIVTKQDLEAFKADILAEMQKLLQALPQTSRRWLKTYQVREMLADISAGTLQTMRNKGKLPYSMLNGLALYEYADIIKLMEELKMPLPKQGGRNVRAGKRPDTMPR